MSDKRKKSVYLPQELLTEVQNEAKRLNRSFSWVLQRAWKLSRPEFSTYPDME